MANQKPSFTAFLIPKILPAHAGARYSRSLVTREQVNLSKRFANECARNSAILGVLHRIISSRLAGLLADNFGVQGIALHYAMRKKYIRSKLDSVIEDVEQVVMLGAGFDTLCLEYQSKYPQVEFFEIDQPSTQEIKLKALKKIPQYDDAQNISFISADLARKQLSEVLESEKRYKKTAKSFFIIEGVLMYLHKPEVEKLLKEISNITPAGSYLIIGSMSELKSGTNARAKVSDVTLAAKKEKYNFAESSAGIKSMLSRAGFELKDTVLYHELQKDLLSDKRLEKIKSERGEHYYFAVKS